MIKCRTLKYIIPFFLILMLIAGYVTPVIADDNKAKIGSSAAEGIGEVPDYSGQLNSKSAILMDAGTKTIFFEKNSHEKLPPASVTKVMTMLLISEAIETGRISLEDIVTISEKAASMGGSQMYMEPGETHTLHELLTGIAMVSANDACVAASEYISGSMEIFVEQMNKKASELGLSDTHFINTNGLPVSDHYTSAYDIAVMSAELIKYEIILPYLTNPGVTMEVGKEGKEKTSLEMINTNKLLRTYSGAIGIKTGFTQDAGYCLAAAAERDGLTLIAVVLGAESSKIRFNEAAALLDYGFANYESVNIAEAGDFVGSVSISKGVAEFTDLCTKEDIRILVPKGKGSEISWVVKPAQDLTAPIKKGNKAGTLSVKRGEENISDYDLVCSDSVAKAGIKQRVSRKINKIFS